MIIHYEEIEHSGLDAKKIASIARRISKAAKEADEMGLEIFGGSGSGSIRYNDDYNKGGLILASLDGCFDGGCGAEQDHGDGLLRGESA